MKKPYDINFSDVAHLYVGQRYFFKLKTGEVFEDVCESVYQGNAVFGFNGYDCFLWDDPVEDFKFILRPPTKLKTDDKLEYYAFCKKFKNDKGEIVTADTPQSLWFLIYKGYDAFDLIAKGWAIDEEFYKKLKKVSK